MVVRKRSGEEKRLPQGSIVVKIEIPIRLSLSMTNSEHKEFKKKLKERNMTVEQYFKYLLYRFFNVNNWEQLEKELPSLKKAKRKITEQLIEELQIGNYEDKPFSVWFNAEMRDDLKLGEIN